MSQTAEKGEPGQLVVVRRNPNSPHKDESCHVCVCLTFDVAWSISLIPRCFTGTGTPVIIVHNCSVGALGRSFKRTGSFVPKVQVSYFFLFSFLTFFDLPTQK